MRTTLHYHLPTFLLLLLTPLLVYLQISPCSLAHQRDLSLTSGAGDLSFRFDPWDKHSVYLMTCVCNLIFVVFWFPETYFYIKGNLYVLTWEEIKAFIGSVYLMVSGKGLIVLLFTFGVKDTRDAILFRKRSGDETELLDMDEVATTSSAV